MAVAGLDPRINPTTCRGTSGVDRRVDPQVEFGDGHDGCGSPREQAESQLFNR